MRPAEGRRAVAGRTRPPGPHLHRGDATRRRQGSPPGSWPRRAGTPITFGDDLLNHVGGWWWARVGGYVDARLLGGWLVKDRNINQIGPRSIFLVWLDGIAL